MNQGLRQSCLVFLLAGIAALAPGAAGTALDDYVAAPHPEYHYGPTPVDTVSGTGYSAKVWSMTSQAWRDPSEVTPSQWQHYLTIIEPTFLTEETALLLVDGGTNNMPVPTSVDTALAALAIATGSVVAHMWTVPNQPLVFADETNPAYASSGRVEDQILALSWDRYRQTGDANWIAHLPMTQSVVAAMDTVQAEHGSVTGFVIAGASKRGWATWLTAAVDSRVEAIIPMVIDLLNLKASMQHHHAVYGYWAASLSPYEEVGLMTWLDSPVFDSICSIVDPYAYRDRLTMPKYILNSTGDQFFLPDSSQLYFDELQGPKYLRYTPNTDHSLNTTAIIDALTFYEMHLDGAPMPQYSWTRRVDGAIEVSTVTQPDEVRLWQATNPTARNFRLDTIGAAWTSAVLTDQGAGLYVAPAPQPVQGWTAFMVELTYPGGTLGDLHVTTDVYVEEADQGSAAMPVHAWPVAGLLLLAGARWTAYWRHL